MLAGTIATGLPMPVYDQHVEVAGLTIDASAEVSPYAVAEAA